MLGHNDKMPVLVSLNLDDNALRARSHFQRLILSSDAHTLKQSVETAGKRAASMRSIPSGQSLAVVRGCGSPITSIASEAPQVQKPSANELPRDGGACDEDLLDASLRSEDELAGEPPSDVDACDGVFGEQAASIDHSPCGQKPAVDRGCGIPINSSDWMRSVDRDVG